MEIRRYRPDDLAALTDLLNTALEDDPEFIPYTTDKLQNELEEASSVWLAVEDERLVGAAFYKPMWYGKEIVPFASQDAEYETIEAALLDRIEPEIDGGEAVVAVPSDQAERIAFLEGRGYAVDGGMVQLVASLDEDRPIPELPDGYRLRSLHPGDKSEFVHMVNAAYDAERLDEAAVDGWLDFPGWSEDWVQVVGYRGDLVAGVVARPDRAYNEHFKANRGYLGPAAVLPAHGQQGLGRALTAASLNFVRSQGMDAAMLYTTQGKTAVHRLTAQLGFRATHRWTFLKKEV